MVVISAIMETYSHRQHCCISSRFICPSFANCIMNWLLLCCRGETLVEQVLTLALMLWRDYPIDVSQVVGACAVVVDIGCDSGHWLTLITDSRWSLLISIWCPVMSPMLG